MSSEVALDLNRRHFTKVRGSISVIGSWYRAPDAQDWEQCLVLIRTGDEYSTSGQLAPCAILLGNAHKWYEGFGDPTYTAVQCAGFADRLRLPRSPETFRRIASLVNEFLEELLTIPPWQEKDGAVLTLGEITLTNLNTGKSTEHLLTDV